MKLFAALLVTASLALVPAHAQEAKPKKPKSNVNPALLQDFPFQGACINARFPGDNVALKGLAIRAGNDSTMLFDTDLMRMAAGWTGGYITTHGVAFDGAHGAHPTIDGEQKFGTRQQPGWANADGQFTDPRKEPLGPLPADWAHWNGLYLVGDKVVLAYTILGTQIHEEPSTVVKDGALGFVRTFKTEKNKLALTGMLAEVEGATGKVEGNTAELTGTNNMVTVVGLAGAPKGVELAIANGNQVVLKLAKGTAGATFKVVIWSGDKAEQSKFAGLLEGKAELAKFDKGGPAHFPQTVQVQGKLNTSTTPDGAYTTDSITAPVDNPWKRRIRFAGMDFFSDGKRAALCTHDGDVWIVSGIDEGLEKLTWKRFATGMYETLGLAIVNDVIYTSGRDQITRYHDLNGDGEADYYENFNNDYISGEGFHEFVFDLQTDKAGNFYFAKANPVNSGGPGFGNNKAARGNGTVHSNSGVLFKLSKDGKKLEIIARGFRAPNGIGVRPDGQVVTSDNEGTWVPSTPINWIQNGNFYGVSNKVTTAEQMESWKQPLCWLAHSDYDNSGGGQVWVTSSAWGPYEGELLHMSYGKSSLFHVMKEDVNGTLQGGVVKFPLKFTSSCMRAHFNPKDHQLYVAGLREWQSDAAHEAGFDRVRYTGKPVYSVSQLHVVKGGVELEFSQPLNKADAEDLQNWSGKRWNYERAEHYGSPEFNVTDPTKKGREPINITAAKLSADGRIVTLAIEDFKKVMQESIKYSIKAKDGTEISQEIQHTVNVIP